jgi:hypothetical protein
VTRAFLGEACGLPMNDSRDQSRPEQPSLWRQLIANPVALGAIVTGYVTLNAAILTYLTNRNSQDIEERKYETNLIADVVKQTISRRDKRPLTAR